MYVAIGFIFSQKKKAMSEKEPMIFNHSNDHTILVPYVHIDRHRFRFNKAAQEICGMRTGKRIHLAYFGDWEQEIWNQNEWYFIVNDDKRGIEIKDETSRGGGSNMNSRPISSKFMGHIAPRVASVKFPILRTQKEWKGSPLWKIDISNPYNSPKSRAKS